MGYLSWLPAQWLLGYALGADEAAMAWEEHSHGWDRAVWLRCPLLLTGSCWARDTHTWRITEDGEFQPKRKLFPQAEMWKSCLCRLILERKDKLQRSKT